LVDSHRNYDRHSADPLSQSVLLAPSHPGKPFAYRTWAKVISMSSPTRAKDPNEEKQREQRLAELSGAMALARLTHQVKELELQTHHHTQSQAPKFTPIKAAM